MESKKLEALLMAVDLGSFTKAAEVMGYTQSGLTHMMNSLEREVGFTLLERGRGDGVLLVPVEPKSARELGMAVRPGEGRQASLQQFLECAQTVLAELEPK